jgi:hypothetical protein
MIQTCIYLSFMMRGGFIGNLETRRRRQPCELGGSSTRDEDAAAPLRSLAGCNDWEERTTVIFFCCAAAEAVLTGHFALRARTMRAAAQITVAPREAPELYTKDIGIFVQRLGSGVS